MGVLLEVKNLGISFGGLRAVDGLNMTVKEGTLVGLIGPNGAGKTTVFNMLTGVYRPTDGSILLEGKSLVGKKPAEICQEGVARTFQNIRLFTQMSVLDNVKVALHNSIRYNLATSFLHLPSYFTKEKEMDEEALKILKILLLDEPAAGMNPNETKELMETIELIRKEFKVTILLIEHDMKLVSGICEYLYVLNFGTELAHGTPTEVLNDPKVIKAYLGE